MHRRRTPSFAKAGLAGLVKKDRETLPLPPMCSAVARPNVKPTRPSPRESEEHARSGGGKMMHRGLTLRQQWGHGNMSTVAGSDPGPEFCHLNHLASVPHSAPVSASFAAALTKRRAVPVFAQAATLAEHIASKMFGGSCPRGDLEHGAETLSSHPVPA
ncbi:hypothetical protein J7T55_008863 [Diaporthe amygdali]|uniref:uncharacterized protein n=1 Tax=Phomopsis amygdali TaxID=1214568 RepID=UPI0022FF1EEC|nr:uncharacterized protein J7T55_008863 [Diaporthe amygdali]KAJ0121696.1 hypothetical protein J7T55_008863 [Diaporthe amygdali]